MPKKGNTSLKPRKTVRWSQDVYMTTDAETTYRRAIMGTQFLTTQRDNTPLTEPTDENSQTPQVSEGGQCREVTPDSW